MLMIALASVTLLVVTTIHALVTLYKSMRTRSGRSRR
jgi:hypothetical protein